LPDDLSLKLGATVQEDVAIRLLCVIRLAARKPSQIPWNVTCLDRRRCVFHHWIHVPLFRQWHTPPEFSKYFGRGTTAHVLLRNEVHRSTEAIHSN
jgi:hypothetical protein